MTIEVRPKESAATYKWTACVYLSLLYAARWLLPAANTPPGTMAELAALVAACGDKVNADGSVNGNYNKAMVGASARYGLVGQFVTPARLLELAAAGPVAALVSGDQINLSPHIQNNDVGHSICVLYPSGTTGIQLDPLAAEGSVGNPFPPSELTAFIVPTTVLPHPAILAFVKGSASVPTTAPITVSFKAGTYTGQQFNNDGSVAKTKPITIGAKGSSAHANLRSLIVGHGPTTFFFYIVDGGLAGYWVQEQPGVSGSATPAPTPPPAPAPAPATYTQKQLDDAVAQERANGDARVVVEKDAEVVLTVQRDAAEEKIADFKKALAALLA